MASQPQALLPTGRQLAFRGRVTKYSLAHGALMQVEDERCDWPKGRTSAG